MESLVEWVLGHAEYAHWYIFGAILLAGLNIPVSADLLIVIGGFLAATAVPEHLWHLYFAIFVGCYFSAWISYWFGRLLGKRFCRYQWFTKLMPIERLDKIQRFYSRHGLWTLLLGRFIPFGVRNGIFMSSGMSRVSFLKFALWDLLACFTWTSVTFYCFYVLGQNYQLLFNHLKIVNMLIFLAFSVTVIALIWYKRRKKRALENL